MSNNSSPQNKTTVPEEVLSAYGFQLASCRIIPFGTGLINRTWKLQNGEKSYIIQRINQQVFRHPEDIAFNMNLLAQYLELQVPDYTFVAAVPGQNGQLMIHVGGDGYYRMFPFVEGSHTLEVLATPEQAYQAAKQFGRFTRLLDQFDVGQLKTTIPSFHDLTLRYQQFLQSIENGLRQRIQEAGPLIQRLINYSNIVNQFEDIRGNPHFRKRVIHHDTKISNVLFDDADKGICVIDLDTVMPGLFISDLGDMMRTYLCPVSEEEKQIEKVQVRPEFYRAVRDGYFSEMQHVLNSEEEAQFFYAGQFMIYMQALRFLTDHLQGDVYYGATYAGHNLVRARNQLQLLDEYSRLSTE